jgi:heme exporter protein CcmD
MEGVLRFLEMGGHGGFVWGAYAAAALVLLALGLLSWHRLRRSESELRRMEARLPGGSRPATGARNQA